MLNFVDHASSAVFTMTLLCMTFTVLVLPKQFENQKVWQTVSSEHRLESVQKIKIIPVKCLSPYSFKCIDSREIHVGCV